MGSLDIIWVKELPAATSRGTVGWSRRAAALVPVLEARPSQWAQIKTYQSSSGASVAARQLRAAMPKTIEIQYRRLGDKEWSLYARSVKVG